MPELTVLLPALNEAKCIGKVIDEIHQSLECDIIVVDNHSKDGTAQIASKKGALVVSNLWRGKGNAINAGLTHVKTPYMVMMDSDFTYPAYYLAAMLALLKKNDIVIAERHIRHTGSMPITNILGNKILSLTASVLFGHYVSDLCTGMWGFNMNAIREFNLISAHFTLEADIFTNAIRNKCSIGRIPIEYRARNGTQSKLHLKHGFNIGMFLIKRRMGLC